MQLLVLPIGGHVDGVSSAVAVERIYSPQESPQQKQYTPGGEWKHISQKADKFIFKSAAQQIAKSSTNATIATIAQ